jgi:hypothetical protein
MTEHIDDIPGPHPESPDWHAGYRAGRAESPTETPGLRAAGYVYRDIRNAIGFLRSCVRSGEQLNPTDEAYIDAALDAVCDLEASAALGESVSPPEDAYVDELGGDRLVEDGEVMRSPDAPWDGVPFTDAELAAAVPDAQSSDALDRTCDAIDDAWSMARCVLPKGHEGLHAPALGESVSPEPGLRAALEYGPEGVVFPNLPHHPNGPDVLEAVAYWLDKVDERDGNTKPGHTAVQDHLRKWAAKMRAALAATDGKPIDAPSSEEEE